MKDVTRNSVTLRWAAPRDDGGADVTSYVVEKRESSRRMWQSVGTVPPDVSELEATGLYEGNQYVFRVAAENVVGLGEPAELKDSVVPKSQFGRFISPVQRLFFCSAICNIYISRLGHDVCVRLSGTEVHCALSLI